MTTTLTLSINGDRLNHSIAQLAEIGGLPQGGVRRIAYSPADVAARNHIRELMQTAEMTVRTDAAGNIIGTYSGTEPNLPAFATGSHIDTVPSGGRYDGTYGVLAGIEVVRVLHENNFRLKHNLEVIVFTDEEGSILGAKAMAGTLAYDQPQRYCPEGEENLQTCLQRIDGDWTKITTAKRTRAEIAAFVELHVEQGGVLETENKQIGVVEGVVGQRRYIINITGRPNHAGTTPMSMRQDALVAASQIVLAVQDIGTNPPGGQVATVGYLTVSPNAANIVPGQVEMMVDMRDLSPTKIEEMAARLTASIEAIASSTQTLITLTPKLKVQPTPAVPQIQTAISTVCQQLGLTYTHLPSRASHDAQEIGRITDMGMIFVPSQAGISHAEDEYTSPEQCTQGANVLLQTFLALDRMYSN